MALIIEHSFHLLNVRLSMVSQWQAWRSRRMCTSDSVQPSPMQPMRPRCCPIPLPSEQGWPNYGFMTV